MKDKDRKIFLYTLIVSVLLHILLILLLTIGDIFSFEPPANLVEETQPITLVFEQPQPPLPEPVPPEERFYELKENPNANQEAPEQTPFISSEFSRSAAPLQRTNTPNSPAPRADAQLNARASQEAEPASRFKTFDADGAILAYNPPPTFSKSLLTGEPEQNKAEDRQNQEGESEVTQKDFDAELVGDFALSTYKWQWAPYMLEFQRKLKRHWYAPPAYYRLGLIYGYTIVQFKIDRQGKLHDLRVLRQVGHHSLEESSVNAIESTFPFLPLPDDFPDPYLTVTMKMIYPNLRELYAK
ncbi:MAG: hypothetical protein GXO78_07870 [Calditrichaeota bacterium]|nr:hypothetical protein [Calditrichota bacterium]